jgi:hypothetical protein
MATGNWRLIDVDALDPENAFPGELLAPQFAPVPLAEIQALASQCRQALQRGETEEALQYALNNVPYGADDQGKVGAPACSNAKLAIDTYASGAPPGYGPRDPILHKTSRNDSDSDSYLLLSQWHRAVGCSHEVSSHCHN